jgi:hypothetical protein
MNLLLLLSLDLCNTPWSAFAGFFQPEPNRFKSQVDPSPRSPLAGQIFVMVNGRTVALSTSGGCNLNLLSLKNKSCSDLSNLHSDATVAEVFDRLIARRLLRPSDLGCCYVSYRSRLLPQDLTLSKIGIGRNSTLTLHWRLRGGARRGNERSKSSADNSC